MGGINLDDKTWTDFISQNDHNSDGKVLNYIYNLLIIIRYL